MQQYNDSDSSNLNSILSLHVGNSKYYNTQFLNLLKENSVHPKRHSLYSYKTKTESLVLRKYFSQPGINSTSFESIELPNLSDAKSPRSTPLPTTIEFNAQKSYTGDKYLFLIPGINDVKPSRIIGTKNKISGTLKERLGKVLRHPRLEASGFSEKIEGEVCIAAAKHMEVVHF